MNQSRNAIRSLIVWFHLVANPGRCSLLIEMPLVSNERLVQKEVDYLLDNFGPDTCMEAVIARRRLTGPKRRETVEMELQQWSPWMVAILDSPVARGWVHQDLLVLPADRLRAAEIGSISGAIEWMDLPRFDQVKKIVEQERRSRVPRSIAFTVSDDGRGPLREFDGILIRALIKMAAREDARLSAA